MDVGIFTDTYLPTVNGASYTIRTWRHYWEQDADRRMDVVYPRSPEYTPDPGEHPVASVGFPLYDGYRIGAPQLPAAVRDVDLVHVHSPFGVGMAGLRLARARNLPVVASYHTPLGHYTEYISPVSRLTGPLERVTNRYERWFYQQADLVLVPSTTTKQYLQTRLDLESPIKVISNGINTDLFQPRDSTSFRTRHNLPRDTPLIGYTGRHGYEKQLTDIIDAAATLDATVVFGGDGPARETVEATAAESNVDARFLGFLDRSTLPEFYSALDVFAFPSPVETQGLVALEANACGTPVVGADAGALQDTIDHGKTGYQFPTGDIQAFQTALTQALDNYSHLSDACLAQRSTMSVTQTLTRLKSLYESVLTDP